MLSKEEQICKIIRSSSQPVLICPESRFDTILENIISDLKISDSDIIIFESTEGVGVKELRDKFSSVFIKPHSSEFKLFIIRAVDRLNIEQANTLLKILEEPPTYARILLSADNVSSVIPTIKSRVKSVILSSDELVNDRESALIGWLKMPFYEYVKEISRLEESDIIMELSGGLEECRRKGLNEDNRELFKLLAEILVLISNTNVNRKLLLEKLYWQIREK